MLFLVSKSQRIYILFFYTFISSLSYLKNTHIQHLPVRLTKGITCIKRVSQGQVTVGVKVCRITGHGLNSDLHYVKEMKLHRSFSRAFIILFFQEYWANVILVGEAEIKVN